MAIKVGNNVKNQKATPALYADVFANRPPFGQTGRLFFSTDTNEIFRDTGTAWVLFLGGSGGGFVPYVGATQNVDLGQYSLITEWYLQLGKNTGSLNTPTLLMYDLTGSKYVRFELSGGSGDLLFTNQSSVNFLTVRNDGIIQLASGKYLIGQIGDPSLTPNSPVYGFFFRSQTAANQLTTINSNGAFFISPNGSGQITANSLSLNDNTWGSNFALTGPTGLVLNDTVFNFQAVYGKTFSRITDNTFNREVRWNTNEGFYSIDNGNGFYSQIGYNSLDIRNIQSGIDNRIYWSAALGLRLYGKGLTAPYINTWQTVGSPTVLPPGNSANLFQLPNNSISTFVIMKDGDIQFTQYTLVIRNDGNDGIAWYVTGLGLGDIVLSYMGGGIFKIDNISPTLTYSLVYSIQTILQI